MVVESIKILKRKNQRKIVLIFIYDQQLKLPSCEMLGALVVGFSANRYGSSSLLLVINILLQYAYASTFFFPLPSQFSLRVCVY